MSHNRAWASNELREAWASAVSRTLVDYLDLLAEAIPVGSTETAGGIASKTGIPSKYVKRAIEELEKFGLITVRREGQNLQISYSVPIRVQPPADARWPSWCSERKKRRPLGTRLRRQVYELDGGVCAYCGKKLPLGNFKVDHIYPEQKRGGTTIDNLTVACSSCNHQKWHYGPEHSGFIYPLWFRGKRVREVRFEQREGLWYSVIESEET